MSPMSSPHPTASFFGPVDESQRETLLSEYLDYLLKRNGPIDPETGRLPRREALLAEMNETDVRFDGQISQAKFDALYADFKFTPDISPSMLVLLLFSKMNAGEAYGVRKVKAVHAKKWRNRTDLPTRAILFAQEEEEYHTRILVGAARHFDVKVSGAYTPSPALRVLIGALAYAPKPLFHPVLFGAEVAGVFVFNWTLQRVHQMVDQPELADALERRLIEVLVDEVGHVALNRLVLNERGRGLGRLLSAQTARGMPVITSELAPTGFDEHALRDFAHFDYAQLPEEVRRRGFFA